MNLRSSQCHPVRFVTVSMGGIQGTQCVSKNEGEESKWMGTGPCGRKAGETARWGHLHLETEFPVAKASLMPAPWRGPCGGRVGEEFESFRGVERWETFQPLLRVLFLGSQAI